MRLTVRDNLADVESKLDALRSRILTARTRAVNTLIGQAERAGFNEINAVYQIPAKTMSQYASTRLATQADVEATITVKGRGFPLSVFQPVQTNVGVTVLIKGKRVTIPHAFMVPKFGQHVFARGSYGGKAGYGGGQQRGPLALQRRVRGRHGPTGETFGRFVFGYGRLPISEIWTLSPPDAFSNPQVVERMNETVDDNVPKQLARELAAVARGF